MKPGERAEVVFLLGQAESRDQARDLIKRCRGSDFDQILSDVTRRWDDLLGTVQVATPDPGMDLMLNRWLLYQTLSCRVWARAAFYQLSSAYGFGDPTAGRDRAWRSETKCGARSVVACGIAAVC